MPIQKRARGGQSGDSFEVFQADLVGLGGQPSTLAFVEAGPLAQLFLEDSDLFLEVFDDVLLVAVDPTGQAYEEESKMVHGASSDLVRAHAGFLLLRTTIA